MTSVDLYFVFLVCTETICNEDEFTIYINMLY